MPNLALLYPPWSGDYWVVASNEAGSATSGVWRVRALHPGGVVQWGLDAELPPEELPDAISLAAGGLHSLALLESGTVVGWGTNIYGQTNVPPGLSNVVAIAAGVNHSLALKSDGIVIAWGRNNSGQTNVPAALTNAVAISAGGNQSLALKEDGTVVQWGFTNDSVPLNLTNVEAIASGGTFHLALLKDSTVAAWGANGSWRTNVPGNLSNVVAVAAASSHALALREDGTIVAWGSNDSGESDVPAGLSNVMAIAAGSFHSVALKNDGTVVAWGDNTYGQTNVPPLSNVKLIAARTSQTLAGIFSPLLQYPVDVSKDLLLIYNTNSADSAFVKDYYIEHRPMVSNANVLGIGCVTNEIIANTDFTNQIVLPVLNWLAANPTKHPQYLILFLDIPSRLAVFDQIGSLSYALQQRIPGIEPFVNHIHMGDTNACKAYIDKLEYIGTNCSPGEVIISASAGGYGNTNYVLDGIRHGTGYLLDYSYDGFVVSSATNGLLASGVSSSAILFYDGIETVTNGMYYNLPHPTGITNVTGYICWGAHSSLGGSYANNGSVQWKGNSGWWIIETAESYNGRRADLGQGTFIKWFSSESFGGENYLHTPVGAVTHIEEPRTPGISDSSRYFSLWAQGKSFANCAWNSKNTVFLQVVGDPLVKR